MAAKTDKFYFENFVEAADCACKAAEYLVECLSHYHPDNIEEMLHKVHLFEHMGDEKKHEMSAALAKAFVTPVDREDLALISQCIDDVSDGVEEVLQGLYVYRIQTVPEAAAEFGRNIAACCSLMKEMLAEFVNFKRPAKLHEMVIELNHLEEECDKLYLAANRRLTESSADVLEIVSWRDIYNKMENCADACEHVGDCVETVVMKNT